MLHLGRLLASPENIRLAWKGLPETNTLTYYVNTQITVKKSFIIVAPGANAVKRFFRNLQITRIKLERLPLASLSSLV